MPDPLSSTDGAGRWREEAWRCYVESGADPDGADARHLNLGEAVEAVRELRRDYEEAIQEVGANWRAEAEEGRERTRVLEGALRESNGALMLLCEWAEEARGHHGIEEVAAPCQPKTEWDDVQDGLAQAARDGREVIDANRASLAAVAVEDDDKASSGSGRGTDG